MAKKRKKTYQKKTTPVVWLIGGLLILGLSIAGLDVPQQIEELFFDAPTTSVQKKDAPILRDNQAPEELDQTDFTPEELKNGNPLITYHPLDTLGRPTGADALLKMNLIGTGTSANQKIRPPGFISGLEPYFHSRGHLIGRQLGGSGDDERNLVTLYQTPVNTPYMTKYENMVRKAVDAGDTVRYRVTPIYKNDELMCEEIKIEAQSIGKHPTLKFTAIIKNAQEEE